MRIPNSQFIVGLLLTGLIFQGTITCKSKMRSVHRTQAGEGGAEDGGDDDQEGTFPDESLNPDGTNGDAPTLIFTANGKAGTVEVEQKSDVEIKWSAEDVDSCTVFPTNWTGVSGTQKVSIQHDMDYLLFCLKGEQQFSKPLSIHAKLPPIPELTLKANNQTGAITVNPASEVEFTWEAKNVTSCTVNPGSMSGLSGTQKVVINQTVVYILDCLSIYGTVKEFVIVNVNQDPSVQMIVDLKANGTDVPITVSYRSKVDITWTSTNAASCILNPGANTNKSGAFTSSELTTSMIYLLSCTSASGEVSMDAAVVMVAPALPPSITVTINSVTPPVTLTRTDSAKISWKASNAETCSLFSVKRGQISLAQVASSIEADFHATSPLESDVFYLSCTGEGGSTYAFAPINVPIAVPKLKITANDVEGSLVISKNSDVSLKWEASDVDSCVFNPGAHTTLSGSSKIEKIQDTTTLTLECQSALGSITSTYVVVVKPQTQTGAIISANNMLSELNATYGARVRLDWTSVNANNCTLSPLGLSGTSGTHTFTATATDTYTLNCTGSDATPSSSAVLVNVSAPPAPKIDFTANGATGTVQVVIGSNLALVWDVEFATECKLNNVSTQSLSSSKIINNIITDAAYKLECSGPGGSSSKTINIHVILQGIHATMVGANFEDLPINTGDRDFNDAVACYRGRFVVDGQKIYSETHQVANITISKRSGCRHRMELIVRHVDGTEEPHIITMSNNTKAHYMNMRPGSQAEVIYTTITAPKPCPEAGPFSSLIHPEKVLVLPNECRTSGR